MDIRTIIADKAAGRPLGQERIAAFFEGYRTGEVSDAQAAALLGAIMANGFSRAETIALTRCLIASGETIDLSGFDKPSVDKHSTGGVGDSVSIALVPLLASCGVIVPKMSGRALGHTGGTIDKIESIPGFSTALDIESLMEALRTVGCVILEPGVHIAPLEHKLYGLRDHTGTIASLGLITASIIAKKVATGAGALVFDVKVGEGAFMRDVDAARSLAHELVGVGEVFEKRCIALLTDMTQPLGQAVGNALEVREAIRVLRGAGGAAIREVVRGVGAAMLELCGWDPDVALIELERALDTGRGLAVMERMIERQGGDVRVVEDDAFFPRARYITDVLSTESGWVTAVAPRSIAAVVAMLGGSRTRPREAIDHAVGVELHTRVGDVVSKDDIIAQIHANSMDGLGEAVERVASAVIVSDVETLPRPSVLERIEGRVA